MCQVPMTTERTRAKRIRVSDDVLLIATRSKGASYCEMVCRKCVVALLCGLLSRARACCPVKQRNVRRKLSWERDEQAEGASECDSV